MFTTDEYDYCPYEMFHQDNTGVSEDTTDPAPLSQPLPQYIPTIHVTAPTNIEKRDQKVSFQEIANALQQSEWNNNVSTSFDSRSDGSDMKNKTLMFIAFDFMEMQMCNQVCNQVVNLILKNVLDQLNTKYASGCTGCRYCQYPDDSWSSFHEKKKWMFYHDLQSIPPQSIQTYMSYYRKPDCHFDIHVSLYELKTLRKSKGYMKVSQWTFSQNLGDIQKKGTDGIVNISLQINDDE